MVGLILKCYFKVYLSWHYPHTPPLINIQVKRISLSKNILRAIDANPDIPPLSQYPRSHQVRHSRSMWMCIDLSSQVTYRYYIGMLSFLNEDFAKVCPNHHLALRVLDR